MAFESLADKLQNVFKNLTGKGRLSEADVKAGLKEVKMALLEADVSFKVVKQFINSVQEQAVGTDVLNGLHPGQMVIKIVNDELVKLMGSEMTEIALKPSNEITVIMMAGLQGAGKTTTTAKIAGKLKAKGRNPLLAACDVYRPAAVEQLQVWGQRNNIPVIAQHTGADSASVIFDAIQAAKSRNVDVLIADTAGRLQNKSHLMEELKKIVRVMKKLDEDAPHEIMLTIDASTGQNAVSQAKLFHEAVGLTGITLTKLDGTAKGGVIFSVADQFGIPIRYIGVGERIEDLRPFKADDFIEALFARED